MRTRNRRQRPPANWAVALRRTPVALWRDDIDHWAAALTYYSVLAVFPTLLVALSVLGLAHAGAGEELIREITALVPAGSREDLRSAMWDLADQRSAAWLLTAVGAASALLSAYNYLSVFRHVLHTMHARADHRTAWRAVPRTLLNAVLLLTLLVGTATVLVLTGGVMRTAGRLLGTGEAGTTAWNVLKWPVLLILVTGMVLMLFRTGPAGSRVPHRGVPGVALAVLLWLTASAGFAVYASNMSAYNRLYGSLGGVIVFLVWLWLSNLALLAGAQFNAELAKLMPCPPRQARHARTGPAPGPPHTSVPGPPATPPELTASRRQP